MIPMEQFYLAFEDALATTPGIVVDNHPDGLLRIISYGQVYCPITFVAQVRYLGDYGNRTSCAVVAGARLHMRYDNTSRVIAAADNNGAPVVRGKLRAIMRPYMKEHA